MNLIAWTEPLSADEHRERAAQRMDTLARNIGTAAAMYVAAYDGYRSGMDEASRLTHEIRQRLLDLLSRIHRDPGHTAAHGLRQSIDDANESVMRLLALYDAAKAWKRIPDGNGRETWHALMSMMGAIDRAMELGL